MKAWYFLLYRKSSPPTERVRGLEHNCRIIMELYERDAPANEI